MGTNYYHYQNVCAHCGRGDAPRHIGKSSGGWCFSLHVYPEDGIKTLVDWEKILGAGGEIRDEYDKDISLKEMLEIIKERNWKPRGKGPVMYASWEEFHERNYSEFGPNNLMRHKVDMKYCIGHGEGTWDLIIGEFS